jgi:hypothetical protein
MSESEEVEGLTYEIMSFLDTGFMTRSELFQVASYYCEDTDLSAETAATLVETLWATRLVEQETWQLPSDADRLQEAFDDLNNQGVVALMNFTCCQTCGTTEIDDAVIPGTNPLGYTFFHAQDAECIPDGATYLSFGPFGRYDNDEGYTAAAAMVGNQVARTLKKHGLTVNWDGTVARRICVLLPDWRKRLPT